MLYESAFLHSILRFLLANPAGLRILKPIRQRDFRLHILAALPGIFIIYNIFGVYHTMEKNMLKWQSPSLGSEAQAHIYGYAGTPIIFFNHQGGSLASDDASLQMLSYQIENGLNIVCTLAVPDYSRIFDENLSPAARLVEYLRIEGLVVDELIPRVGREYTDHFFIAAGIGHGGYLATNMVLKYPEKFGKLISVCGRYDMRPGFDGQQTEAFYYNNPVEFLPHLNEEAILAQMRRLDIRLVSHQQHPDNEQAERISGFLGYKDVEHDTDTWAGDTELNEQTYARMFAKHVP